MKEILKEDLKAENEPKKENEQKDIIEEIQIEDLAIDGICGVY